MSEFPDLLTRIQEWSLPLLVGGIVVFLLRLILPRSSRSSGPVSPSVLPPLSPESQDKLRGIEQAREDAARRHQADLDMLAKKRDQKIEAVIRREQDQAAGLDKAKEPDEQWAQAVDQADWLKEQGKAATGDGDPR